MSDPVRIKGNAYVCTSIAQISGDNTLSNEWPTEAQFSIDMKTLSFFKIELIEHCGLCAV